jgi:hypothetical protein
MDVSVERFLKDFKGRIEMKADISEPKFVKLFKQQIGDTEREK